MPAGQSVVVVGGGVSGLVAARTLARKGFRVTLLEASATPGGCVATHTVAGIRLDAGAESFATRGGTVGAYLDGLGLGAALVTPNPTGAWVQLEGDAAPLPKNTVLGIPGVPLADDVRRIIGWSGVLRAQLDRYIPLVRVRKSSSLGDLVRRRMGRKVLDRLVAPIVSGVHSAHPDLVDVDAVAPGLLAAMTVQGSLSGAVLSLIARRPRPRPIRAADVRAPGGSPSDAQTAAGSAAVSDGADDAGGGRPDVAAPAPGAVGTAGMPRGSGTPGAVAAAAAPGARAGSAVGGIDGGMFRLVEELVADCERFGVDLRFGMGVSSIRRVDMSHAHAAPAASPPATSPSAEPAHTAAAPTTDPDPAEGRKARESGPTTASGALRDGASEGATREGAPGGREVLAEGDGAADGVLPGRGAGGAADGDARGGAPGGREVRESGLATASSALRGGAAEGGARGSAPGGPEVLAEGDGAADGVLPGAAGAGAAGPGAGAAGAGGAGAHAAEWMTVLDDGSVLGSNGVVVAAGFRAALALLQNVDGLQEQTAEADWPGSSAVTLATLVLDAPELDAAPRGTGVLVAEDVTSVRAKALTHATAKWPWLAAAAGPGRHVARLSYGRGGENPGGAAPAVTQADALRDASTLLGLRLDESQVRGFALVEWRDSLAFATTGHRARVDALVEAVHEHPGLEVVGAWISGTGLAYVIDGTSVKASELAVSLLSS